MGRVQTRRRAALVGLALAIAAAGCGKPAGPPGAGTGAPAGRERIRIAMIGKSSTNPVFLSARTGAEAAAKEISARAGIDVEVLWLTPPQEDGQLQAQRLAQAVNEGASAVLIACSDAGKVTGAINDAVARGVPVMTFDSDAPASRRFAYYGVDDVETGRRVMRELAQLMGGKGKVGVLAGNQNAPNLRKRVEGVKEEAAKYPAIQIVGVFNHTETPQDAAAEVVRVGNAYPEINGWAFIGGWPLWTKSLVNELDPTRLKIASVDGLPAQLPYVARDVVPVLLAQPTYQWGYVGVSTIVDRIHFKKDVTSVPPMELVRVTKDNLGEWARQLRAWGFTDVPDECVNLAR
jgi:ribose transport system substrate-binding protein